MLLCFHTANNMVFGCINKENKKKKKRKSYINIQDDLVTYMTPAKLLIVILMQHLIKTVIYFLCINNS